MLKYLAAVVAVLSLLLTGCSSGDGASNSADAQQLTVTVGDVMTFEPATLTARAGRPVALTVRSAGATDHDFVITDMPARDVHNQGGDGHGGHGTTGMIAGHPQTRGQVTVHFTPTAPGTYAFYCSLPGHRELGMQGTVTII